MALPWPFAIPFGAFLLCLSATFAVVLVPAIENRLATLHLPNPGFLIGGGALGLAQICLILALLALTHHRTHGNRP